MMHLKHSDDTQEPIEGGLTDRNWSNEVEELEEEVRASELEVGPLGTRTYTEANLRPAYESGLIASFVAYYSSTFPRRGTHEPRHKQSA